VEQLRPRPRLPAGLLVTAAHRSHVVGRLERVGGPIAPLRLPAFTTSLAL
jgi:hypothetical protein